MAADESSNGPPAAAAPLFPPDLQSRVGEKSQSYADIVTSERITAFASAVGAVLVRGEASSTYLTTCRKGEFEFFEKLGVSLARVLHVEQDYTYDQPVLAGDRLLYETELVSAVEKGKGKMLFLNFLTAVQIERDGRLMAAGSAKSTILVR